MGCGLALEETLHCQCHRLQTVFSVFLFVLALSRIEDGVEIIRITSGSKQTVAMMLI